MSIADSINKLMAHVAGGGSVESSPEELTEVAARIMDAIDRALQGRTAGPREDKKLYFSEVGSPCVRKTWYRFHGTPGEQLDPSALIKFLYGDILEELLLFLAMKAGHEVRDQQRRVEIPLDNDWVLSGRIDAIIDNAVVDVKSASTFAMKKFDSEHSLRADDPFGYIDQLTGYQVGLDDVDHNSAEFLVVDKTLGHVKSVSVKPEANAEAKLIDKCNRIATAMEQPTPPPKMDGHSVPEGKSGNMKLCTTCSYCAYKQTCHTGLRTFLSSRGPVFFTTVKREPKMTEVTDYD